jgi:hypothetical protein
MVDGVGMGNACRLPNGVRAVVVHDQQAVFGAASVNVATGYMDDPTDLPGLAHFLEHVVHLVRRLGLGLGPRAWLVTSPRASRSLRKRYERLPLDSSTDPLPTWLPERRLRSYGSGLHLFLLSAMASPEPRLGYRR